MAEFVSQPPLRGAPPALPVYLQLRGWSMQQSRSTGEWYYMLTPPDGGRATSQWERPTRGWPRVRLLERDQTDGFYEEAKAEAVVACAADTAGQTCYICTEAVKEETNEGFVSGFCACRGGLSCAHVSCLARGAELAVERGGVKKKFRLWYACGQCEQYYHGVVQCALGWACWKTYVDRPEGDQIRDAAMGVLGQGLSAAHHHEDALSVGKARLSMLRRLGGSEHHMLGAQNLIANAYGALGRLEEAVSLKQEVYAGRAKFDGEEHEKTLIAASNYAGSLIELDRFEEAKTLLRRIVPVARRVLGEGDGFVLTMRRNYGIALFADPGATLDDLGEAVTTSEDTARIARRVLGGSHPDVVIIERSLRCARAKQLRARETPDDESVAIPAQELDTAQVTATKKRQRCDTTTRERSRPRVSAENDADDIE